MASGARQGVVRDEDDMTIIVTGTADRRTVEDYAASLTTG